MIEEGAEIIWRRFDKTLPYGSSFGEHVAREVFRAMNSIRVRKKTKAKKVAKKKQNKKGPGK
jgi:hypothetical protein